MIIANSIFYDNCWGASYEDCNEVFHLTGPCESDPNTYSSYFDDPSFVDPNNDDYHLDPNSPCIDTGDNSLVPADFADLDNDANTLEPTPLDLDRSPRISFHPETGDPNAPIVDMGAYELFGGPACWLSPAQCRGDANNDGDVNFDDFIAMQQSYNTSYGDADYNPCADFNRDGQVGFDDFLIQKQNYNTTPTPDCTPGGTWPPQ